MEKKRQEALQRLERLKKEKIIHKDIKDRLSYLNKYR
jgi:hypothetical protein